MRGFFQWVGAIVVVGVLVFYGAGGWYFSNELIADGFSATSSDSSMGVRVAGVASDTIDLEDIDDSDDNLYRDGVFGLAWEGGYARVADVLDESGGHVTRSFSADFGPAPVISEMVDVEAAAFPSDPGAAFGLDWENVIVESPVGELEAWLVPGDPDNWVVHIHGKGAARTEALRAVGPVAEAGYTQLVVTYRNDEGGPADPSGFYQYGVTEWEDLAAAVDLAVAEGADRVVLYGYSTGAAIALAYLERTPTNPVVGAVFDSPNIDFAATVDFNASLRTLPFTDFEVPQSLAWVARMITAMRIGIDWDQINYVERSSGLTIPVLVFHGEDDTTVPIEISERFERVAPEAELVAVAGAAHVQSWNVDPAAYEAKLLETIEQMTSN